MSTKDKNMDDELIVFDKPTKRKTKKISVTVIHSKGDTALIEWVEKTRLKRGYLPASLIDADNTVSDDTLEAVTPYGVPWEAVLDIHVASERFEQALHAHDIWTLNDCVTKPKEAIAALQSVYRVDLAALLQAARKFEKGE